MLYAKGAKFYQHWNGKRIAIKENLAKGKKRKTWKTTGLAQVGLFENGTKKNWVKYEKQKL